MFYLLFGTELITFLGQNLLEQNLLELKFKT